MKMIVGRTWNAKMNPISAPPLAPSFPNTNSEPTNENPNTLLILSPIQAKRACPAYVFSTKRASANWRPTPQNTVFHRTAARLVESA